MLKTIKTTKQMRLDELIKYVWENDFSMKGFMVFKSDCDKFEVRISSHMLDYVWDKSSKFSSVPRHTTFTVEVEEEITEDTKLEGVQEVYIDRDDQRIEIESFRGRYSINEILDEHDVSTDSLQIYAMINGKKELVWERDEE